MVDLAPAVRVFLDDYLAIAGAAVSPDDIYVDHFCDDETNANLCVQLVLAGEKRATCSVLAAYAADGESPPQPGALLVVTDWGGAPGAIVRTTRTEIRAFHAVDAAFAAAEGEGDKTLGWWRSVHWPFIERECAHWHLGDRGLSATARMVRTRPSDHYAYQIIILICLSKLASPLEKICLREMSATLTGAFP